MSEIKTEAKTGPKPEGMQSVQVAGKKKKKDFTLSIFLLYLLILVLPINGNAFSLGLTSGPGELYLQKGSSTDLIFNLSSSNDSLVELSSFNGPFEVSLDNSPLFMEKDSSKLVFARVLVPEITQEGVYKLSILAFFKSPTSAEILASDRIDLMINVLASSNSIYYTVEGINLPSNPSITGFTNSDLFLERDSKAVVELTVLNEGKPVASPADFIAIVHDIPENVKVKSTEIKSLKQDEQASIFIEVSTDENTDFKHFFMPVYLIEKGTSRQWLAGNISLTVIPNHDLIVNPAILAIDFKDSEEKTFSLTLKNPSKVAESFKTVITGKGARLENPVDENIFLKPLEEKTISFIASKAMALDSNAVRISFIGPVSRHASILFSSEKAKEFNFLQIGISGLVGLGPGSILLGILIIGVFAMLYLKTMKKTQAKGTVKQAPKASKMKLPFFQAPAYIVKMKHEGVL